jgi:hypothetical protein
MLKIQQISLIAVIAVGVGALLIAGTGLTPAAQAHRDGGHHHNGGTHISVKQSIHQSNDCSESICANIGVNNVNFGHQ